MRFIVLALVALAGLVPSAHAAAPAPPNTAVRTDVITEVNPLGWRVVAVAVEYRNADQRRQRTDIPNAAFTVTRHDQRGHGATGRS